MRFVADMRDGGSVAERAKQKAGDVSGGAASVGAAQPAHREGGARRVGEELKWGGGGLAEVPIVDQQGPYAPPSGDSETRDKQRTYSKSVFEEGTKPQLEKEHCDCLCKVVCR